MPNSIRPGDVLADRYRLVDLLTESGGGRFWRAHDRVLARHVALHVIDADDERAPGLLEAARRSATILDPHLLRVLDADQVDGLCFVVNEWGSGTSLDIMLANEGPLAARRAAWLVAEVASAIAVAHTTGIAHGRLVPENVLVDRTGAVRVIGFSVDAALHGLPPGRTATDVADLGGLLYYALTGKWPGASRSAVPDAPQEHGRVLRPRQVRAGIPRPLDSLCDEVVNPYAGHASRTRDSHDLDTAAGICDYLAEFVGDPGGLAEAEAAAQAARPHHQTVILSKLPEAAAPAENATGFEPEPAPEPAGEPEPAGPATPPAPVEQPTQAGLPIFDDETDDVSWLVARATPAPPPPPFEEPPERPLFAPQPSDGAPVRTPRPGSQSTNGTGDFWPWESSGAGTGLTAVIDEDDDGDEVPGRSWLRLALAIGLGLLLLVAIVVAYNLGRGKTPLGAEPSDQPSSASPSPTPSATLLTGLVASDLDPQGDPPDENPELAPLAVDGDPTTAWRTMTYTQNFGPGGLKTGVGLTIDLGATTDVASVDLTLIDSPTDVSLYLTDRAPSGVRDLTPIAQGTLSGTHKRFTLDEPASGRYLTVWLTSLPATEGGFRGQIAEVAVRG